MPGYPRPRRVRPTALPELASALNVPAAGAAGTAGADADRLGAATVTGVTHASTEVRPGDLYAALPGSRHHGAEFVEQARVAGAVAVFTDRAGAAAAERAGLPALVVDDPRAVLGVLASRVYGEPTAALTVIGLTGTAGKTSTAYLVAAGLRAAGRVPGLIGTVETRLGELVIDSARTTPEATDLHALFAVAVEQGVDGIAMEVSSHALSLGRVGGVRFAVGGFTNLGVDHLDFHADVEEYFQAKARLFDGRCDTEIVNFDDPAGRRLIQAGSVTYSAAGNPEASWYATDVTGQGYAQRFVAQGPAGLLVEAGVRLPGRHNVANALLALGALTAVGVDPSVAAAAIAAAPGAPGRMEFVEGSGPVLGVVDYAHKPDAVAEVLAALRALATGRVICVIGAGGDRDRAKRPLMGAAAAAGADLVIVTDDNPRTEEPAAIRAEVLAGALRAGGGSAGALRAGGGSAGALRAGGEIVEVDDRRAAIAEAVRLARPGDVVAVLGKGHETGQEIKGRTFPFDDRVELAAALRTAGAAR